MSDKVQLTVRISRELHERLRRIAIAKREYRQGGMSRIVEEALRRYLPELEKTLATTNFRFEQVQESKLNIRISKDVVDNLRQVSEKLNLSYNRLVELSLRLYLGEYSIPTSDLEDDFQDAGYRIYSELYVPALKRGSICLPQSVVLDYIKRVLGVSNSCKARELFDKLVEAIILQEYYRGCYICVNPYATEAELGNIIRELRQNLAIIENPHASLDAKYSYLALLIYALALVRYLRDRLERNTRRVEEELAQIVLQVIKHAEVVPMFLARCLPRLATVMKHVKKLATLEVRTRYFRRF